MNYLLFDLMVSIGIAAASYGLVVWIYYSVFEETPWEFEERQNRRK